MTSPLAEVSKLLLRYVPEVLAQSMLRRARAAASTSDDPHRVYDELRTSVRLFVEPGSQQALLMELEQITGKRPETTRERIIVASEMDVSRARLRARELSQQLGGGAFGAQRASTAVSELARNIVMYAGKGQIEIIARHRVPPVLSVRASDQGPGIVDTDAVLSGAYKSKTGLGRGLFGVKRLASKFTLQSSPAGTIVEADIPL
ncbi:MAG: hypothetical protein HOW73_10700 [Polyangiaceae bacterium]|nr:hypothetical protein [Polyangiaceae bacterium]